MIKKTADKKNKIVRSKRKWRYPAAIERDYQRMLRAVARVLHEATMSKIDLIKSMLPARQDEADSEYIVGLIASVYAATGATSKTLSVAARIASQVRGYTQEEFYAILRSALRVNIFIPEPDLRKLLDEWTAQNVRLIKTIPEQYFGQLQGIVSRGLVEGSMIDDMAEDIEKLYEVTSRKAQLIARDQVGSLNGMITQQRQMTAGITFYQWSSSKDARVRESHIEREGRYYFWPGKAVPGMTFNGKPVLTLYNGKPPGMEINCRCVALPIIPIADLTLYRV